jgi:hypothetical protein
MGVFLEKRPLERSRERCSPPPGTTGGFISKEDKTTMLPFKASILS